MRVLGGGNAKSKQERCRDLPNLTTDERQSFSYNSLLPRHKCPPGVCARFKRVRELMPRVLEDGASSHASVRGPGGSRPCASSVGSCVASGGGAAGAELAAAVTAEGAGEQGAAGGGASCARGRISRGVAAALEVELAGKAGGGGQENRHPNVAKGIDCSRKVLDKVRGPGRASGAGGARGPGKEMEGLLERARALLARGDKVAL